MAQKSTLTVLPSVGLLSAMDYHYWLVLILSIVYGATCWTLTLFGLPGNWMLLLGAGFLAYFSPASLAWSFFGVAAALILFGELVEFIAGASGIAKGGTRKGALFGMLGSLVGSLVGGVLGAPVPVIGPIIGILFFASLGAMLGTVWGESRGGSSPAQSWAIGRWAFVGRLLGSVAKMVLGTVALFVLLAGLFFS